VSRIVDLRFELRINESSDFYWLLKRNVSNTVPELSRLAFPYHVVPELFTVSRGEKSHLGGELRTRSLPGACLFPEVTLPCGKKSTVLITGSKVASDTLVL
jgi:hypothetical protein